MSGPCLVPARDAAAEFTEKRSRFLGQIFRVASEAEAAERLQAVRRTHYDAKHNVYAYLLRDGKLRFSDDGEPGGTAGMPVLEVLRREGVSDVLCVVTRYFGGILLGAGGLTRAYARAAKLGLEAAGLAELRPFVRLNFSCSYPLYEPVRQELTARGGVLEPPEFGAAVAVSALLPKEALEPCLTRLRDLSGGAIRPEPAGEIFRPVQKEGYSLG